MGDGEVQRSLKFVRGIEMRHEREERHGGKRSNVFHRNTPRVAAHG